MELVNDLTHFSKLISLEKSKNQKILTNCFFLPDHIVKTTSTSNLYFERNTSGLFFLQRELSFYTLFYYVHNKFETKLDLQFLSEFDDPVLLNLIYSQNSNKMGILSDHNFWLTHKFSLRKVFKKMILYKISAVNELKKSHDKGSIFRYVCLMEIDALISLWQNSLDLLSNPIPSKENIIQSINNKEVFCLIDSSKNMLGALQCRKIGSWSEISHVSIDNKFRGLGLGFELMIKFLQITNYFDNDQYYLWVAEDNFPAVKLYEKLGFKYDGKFTKQFIWRK